jgi:RNA polymerase sigma factor (TIGR02999 family)
MPNDEQQTVTRLLSELRQGHREVYDQLFPLVYDELRGLAHRQRRKWTGNETLNTTALVHEAYLKLVNQPQADFESEAHFLAAAARAIRHILINYARDQQAQKRGGGLQRVTLTDLDPPSPTAPLEHRAPETIIVIDDALKRLAELSERQSRIVECRFFGGMTIKQTAVALGLSTATVTRGWAMAQAWLFRELRTQLGEA